MTLSLHAKTVHKRTMPTSEPILSHDNDPFPFGKTVDHTTLTDIDFPLTNNADALHWNCQEHFSAIKCY